MTAPGPNSDGLFGDIAFPPSPPEPQEPISGTIGGQDITWTPGAGGFIEGGEIGGIEFPNVGTPPPEPEVAATLAPPTWLPQELVQIWIDEYIAAGGDGVAGAANIATERVRQSSEYDTYFPGLRREDGSLRYAVNPEATYFNNIESFRNIVEGLGLNADIFSSEYVDLITGDTSPLEFRQRVDALWSRVALSGNAIRDWYAENLNIDMTNEGILASIMSPNIEQAVLNRQITMAEIGGTAAMHNFDITTSFVDALAANGMDREEAQRLFGTAERLVPMLGALAARHGDTDDDFDIYEYADAMEFYDPTQTARVERLQAQEAAQYTGGFLTAYRPTEYGGLRGIVEL